MGDYFEVTKEDWSFGEISPPYQGRVSSPEYRAGSALVYNMIPRSGGGLRRRPGSRYVDVPPVDANTACRFFPFTAAYGQRFALLLCIHSAAATVYVYSQATHARVATITTNVSPFKSSDIASITYAQTNGMTWFFLRSGAGSSGGQPVFYVSNTASDGSGTWQATKPTFTNTTGGGGETFSATDHYPACGEFYAGRLFLASTNANPLGIWGSSIPAPPTAQTYLDFSISATPVATDGIYLLQNDVNAAGIRWLFAGQSMLMATDKAVWMEQAENYPTPATFAFKRSAAHGVLASSRPQQVVNVGLYIGVESKSLRCLTLSLQRGFYADSDLSKHAEHLLSRKVVDFAVMMRPEPMAWLCMQDGTLVGAAVQQRDNGLVVEAGCGFSQHQLGGGGLVTSVLCLSNDYYDELWMTVSRAGAPVVEYLYLDDLYTTTQAQSFYVDCGVTLAGPALSFSGLPSPLYNKEAAGLGDGAVMPRTTVDAFGNLTYTTSVTVLNVGFPYYSAFEDLRPVSPSGGRTPTAVHTKKLEKIWMILYNSLGGWAGPTPPSDPLNNPGETLVQFWDQMQIWGVAVFGSPPEWISQVVAIDAAGASSPDSQVYVDIVDPVPFNLVGYTARYGKSET